MSNVGQIERKAQERVAALVRDQLEFDYLGNWEHREGNSNVEVQLLEMNLEERGYGRIHVSKAVERLRRDASLGGGRDLYEANRDVYDLLRYGVKVKPGAGEQTETEGGGESGSDERESHRPEHGQPATPEGAADLRKSLRTSKE